MATAAHSTNSDDNHMTSLVDIITCPICMEIPDNHVTLVCFHSFCAACVGKMRSTEVSDS